MSGDFPNQVGQINHLSNARNEPLWTQYTVADMQRGSSIEQDIRDCLREILAELKAMREARK